jgi:predicted transcriptional regulator
MNIQATKLELIEWISRLSDSSVIDKLKKMKEELSIKEDWASNLTEVELESIKRGIKDIEEGKVHSHETARNIYEKFLKDS